MVFFILFLSFFSLFTFAAADHLGRQYFPYGQPVRHRPAYRQSSRAGVTNVPGLGRRAGLIRSRAVLARRQYRTDLSLRPTKSAYRVRLFREERPADSNPRTAIAVLHDGRTADQEDENVVVETTQGLYGRRGRHRGFRKYAPSN